MFAIISVLKPAVLCIAVVVPSHYESVLLDFFSSRSLHSSPDKHIISKDQALKHPYNKVTSEIKA